MSQVLINEYLRQLDVIKKVSGSSRETIVREAFKDLLKDWGRQEALIFLAEYPLKTATRTNITVDGALVHELRMPLGYWEAKDERDDLDDEIEKKLRKGYPQDNIIFSDDVQAVLIQHREEVLRCEIINTGKLEQLLKLFFSYERPEIASFRAAVAQFKEDLPAVLHALREMIETQEASNQAFQDASAKFLAHAQEAINPTLGEADVREMLIQHILTEEIFSKVFDSEFHHENNVARELYALENVFFTGALKKQTLKGLEPYYAAIRAAAAQIGSHHEKQTFLKAIYENFYKVYNVKAADRLGVVYTPNEIVRFMVDATDWLCDKHFGRTLIDKDVEILDPATGTGTFICELLEHFRGQPKKLERKYLEELHANEVAILPYYVANLNIEATYAAITGTYAEFPNLCFVDTLDNVGLHTAAPGTTAELFGSMSEENVARIKRQNSRRISVIIGNPPYNANQANENDNNKNREYPSIDRRISQTYIAESTARKTKLYDMYVRFFRWASDRIASDGVIAFVSNNSFIDSRTFDGFRKVLATEFNEIWIVDLKGNARTSGERRKKEGGNIFEDQIRVGVAIWFCVKKRGAKGCKIMYDAVQDYANAEEKFGFLTTRSLSERKMESIRPDAAGNWIDQGSTEFNTLLPLGSAATKKAKSKSSERAIFKLYSLGVSTNRDEWLYGHDDEEVSRKMKYFISEYDRQSAGRGFTDAIKWSRNLKRRFAQRRSEPFDAARLVKAAYRPFVSFRLYDSDLFVDEAGAKDQIFPVDVVDCTNELIMVCGHPQISFAVHAIDHIPDAGYASRATQAFPRWRYKDGVREENVTDWAVRQFNAHYAAIEHEPNEGTKQKARSSRKISKDEIFKYCYAVLHDPMYQAQYAFDLKRELPRIPLYPKFWRWVDWGEKLLQLHVGYDHAEPWPVTRVDEPDAKARAAGRQPKPVLRSNPDTGKIQIDTETTLAGVPREAWTYRFGNRSGLDWVLEQYRETKPRDPTIRERFNTYQFAEFKEPVIDLLRRVVRVSVETARMLEEMKSADR